MATKKFNRAAAWFANPHNLVYVIGIVTLVLLSTGALAQSGNVYGNRSAQSASPVVRGFVVQTREVEVEPTNPTRYAGTAVGSALGGGIGYALGKKSSSSTALGIVGALLGGMGGAAVTEHLGASRAVEYLVQVPAQPGRAEQLLAITQPDPGQHVLPGDAVYLVNTQGTWRVIKAALPAAPAQRTEPASGRWERPVQGLRSVEVNFDGRP